MNRNNLQIYTKEFSPLLPDNNDNFITTLNDGPELESLSGCCWEILFQMGTLVLTCHP